MKVYIMKQATQKGGKWDKKKARIERYGLKLSTKQANLLNENYKFSGRYYEVDEKATKAYLSAISNDK